MIGVESLMTFMNILLFVFFVLLMFSRQKDENARILQLNWVLSYKNDQLRRANIKLKEYSETIRHMTETEERNRLAREIHDTLGHTLTGIVVSADAGKILMDAAPEEARKRFDVIADTARQGLEDVRRSIRALRPDALDRNGLWKALEIMVSDFHNSTGAVIVYEQNAGDPALASDEEDAVYRIVQEGLTNAIRHGQATRISLSIGKQEEYLRIRITDNGTGVREQKEGFGLNHMRERLEMLKGELKFGNRDDGESGACLEGQSLKVILSVNADMEVVGIAGDGSETLKVIEECRPDVVLMDIRMPVMDGVECTARIKEKHPEIKVIALTTFDDDKSVFGILKNGAITPGLIFGAFLACCAVAMVFGAFNGTLVSVFGIQPMIATLILFTCGRSIAYWINGGATPTIENPIINAIGSFIPGVPVPTPILIVILMGVLFGLLFRFTTMGLYIQTVGINQGAARLNGIHSVGIKLLSFVLLGVCCAVSGVIGVSRLGLINHETLLINIEMDAILAVAIGGNSLGGGKFKMIGSVLGAYAIQMLTITLYAMKVPSTDVKAYKAIVIILLVVMGSPVVKAKVDQLRKKIRMNRLASRERGRQSV